MGAGAAVLKPQRSPCSAGVAREWKRLDTEILEKAGEHRGVRLCATDAPFSETSSGKWRIRPLPATNKNPLWPHPTSVVSVSAFPPRAELPQFQVGHALVYHGSVVAFVVQFPDDLLNNPSWIPDRALLLP